MKTRWIIAAILLSAQLHASGFSTLQGIVSIIANTPAAYEAIAHPKATGQKIGGSVKSVAKKVRHSKAKRT